MYQKHDLEQIIAQMESLPQSEGTNQVLEQLQAFSLGYLDFRQICDHLYDGIHITDGSGKVLYINPAYIQATGITPQDVVGRYVQDIEAEGALYKGSVTGQVLQERRQISAVAYIIKNDKEVLVTGTPVFDAQGNIQLVVTNNRDFFALKQLEKKLQTLTQERDKVHEELAYLRNQQIGEKSLLYCSDAMKAVLQLVHTVAASEVSVLLTGESGTGKELIANEIYQHSHRKGKPFIKVNCAAIPTELLESELFGYEAGAFTGAKNSGKVGLFTLANTGVLLLDEIGELPLSLQSKLLRVLQERELTPVGGQKAIPLDIRLIASTNRNLHAEVEAGRFREDLYYRLNVVPVALLSLRKRKEDIPLLATEFCATFSAKHNRELVLTPESLDLLSDYPWPGNVRELENLIERLVVTSTSTRILPSQVYRALHGGAAYPAGEQTEQSLKGQVQAFERTLILRALEREGSYRKAAKVLGVDHSTLSKKCALYGLSPSQWGSSS